MPDERKLIHLTDSVLSDLSIDDDDLVAFYQHGSDADVASAILQQVKEAIRNVLSESGNSDFDSDDIDAVKCEVLHKLHNEGYDKARRRCKEAGEALDRALNLYGEEEPVLNIMNSNSFNDAEAALADLMTAECDCEKDDPDCRNPFPQWFMDEAQEEADAFRDALEVYFAGLNTNIDDLCE